MAVVRKTGLIQVRCRPEDLAAFEAACQLVGIKATERIRRFMVEEAALIQRRAANNARWHATEAQRAVAAADAAAAKAARLVSEASVSTPTQKPPVGAVNQPQTLSERRKAEKLAKQAKMAKRENRYLDD